LVKEGAAMRISNLPAAFRRGAVVVAAVISAACMTGVAKADDVIQPEAVSLGRPVDFERDVYPILDAKCIACHNVAIHEHGLILENVAAILKGGRNGPAVVAREPENSRLFTMAARSLQPAMPPLPNKVEAAAVTPRELGILRQWILEGAAAGLGSGSKAVAWSALPSSVQPVYSLAMTPDGLYAAAGRGNKVVVYNLSTGELAAGLADPFLQTLQEGGKPLYGPGATHRDLVHAVAFAPNGRTLATAGYREVKLWTRPDAPLQWNLSSGVAGAATAAAVSPDQKWIAAAAADFGIRLWNAADGQLSGGPMTGHAAVVSGMVFTPDSQSLVSVSQDRTVRVWSVPSGALIGLVELPTAVNSVAVTIDGTRVLVGGSDHSLRAFPLPTASPRQLPTGTAGADTAASAAPDAAAASAASAAVLAVSADRKWVAVATGENKVEILDAAAGSVSGASIPFPAAVRSLAFTGDARRLLAVLADRTVKVVDVSSAALIQEWGVGSADLNVVATQPGGSRVIVGVADGQASLYRLDAPAPRTLTGLAGIPSKVMAVSEDGRSVANAAMVDGKPAIQVRDIAAGNITHTFVGHEGPITAIRFSPGTDRLVSGSEDKTARIWSIGESKELIRIADHAAAVTAVAFSPDGERVVTGAADNVARVWNAADGVEALNLAGLGGAVTGVVWQPGSRNIITASADATLRIWNPDNGQQIAATTLPAGIRSLTASRDGAWLAVGLDNGSVVVVQSDLQQKPVLSGVADAPITSVSFSADASLLAATSADGAASLYDWNVGVRVERPLVATGVGAAVFGPTNEELVVAAGDQSISVQPVRFERSFVGASQPIAGAVFSPGGDAVTVASQDGSLRRYPIGQSQPVWTQNQGIAVRSLAQSADGHVLATAGDGNQVRFWNAGDGGNPPRASIEAVPAAVKSLAFATDGQSIAMGLANNQVLVVNTQTGDFEQVFTSHTGAVDGVATVGEDGRSFVSVAVGDPRVWIVPTLSQKRMAGHNGPIHGLAVNPADGNQVYSACEDGAVRVFDLNSLQVVRQVGHGGGPVYAVTVRADGQRFASVGADGALRVFDANNGAQVSEQRGDLRSQRLVAARTQDDAEAKALLQLATNSIPVAEKLLADRTEGAKKAAEAKAAADHKLVEETSKLKGAMEALAGARTALEAAKDDAALKAAVTEAEKALAEQTGKHKAAETEVSRATTAMVQADRDVELATTGLATAKAKLESATELTQTAAAGLAAAQEQAQARMKPYRGVAFNKAGNLLATVGELGAIHTWNSTTGQPCDVYEAHAAGAALLSALGTSGFVSAGSDGEVKTWFGEAPWSLAAVLGPSSDTPDDITSSVFVDRVTALEFNADGTLLATGGGDPSRSGEVIVWNVAERRPQLTIAESHSDVVYGLSISRDGKYLASCGSDKFVKVFELATGQFVKSFEGHTNHVLDVSWRSDGRFLASSGADNVVKVWNFEVGEQSATITGFGKQVTAIQFMGRGPNIVTSCGDRTVRFHQSENSGNFRNFGGAKDYLFCVAASDNEQIVAAGGQDGSVYVWNGQNAQLLYHFPPPTLPGDKAQAAR
jgi:WD40 repeat protein